MIAKHVVGLSGGKDSTALALWLVEHEPREYEFICNETGNELPDMLAHWDRLERLLGSPLKRVRHIEAKYGHTFRSPGRDTWPVGLKEMGEAFASGRQPRKSNRTTPCRVCSL